LHGLRAAILALHLEPPSVPFPACAYGAGTRQYPGAVTRGIDEIEDHEPRIIDPAIGIFEGAPELRPQRHPFGNSREVEAAAWRQALAAAEMIVEEQPGPSLYKRPPIISVLSGTHPNQSWESLRSGFVNFLDAIVPDFARQIIDTEVGISPNRSGLDLKTRELILIAAH
jgi:hypothetical protein